ncbi:MAG TPA: DUF2834 domain-containing protein [Longimicrobiales bacterium]|nr:DUF2834 domain-containing protein [Longimicrobiales bacterium]
MRAVSLLLAIAGAVVPYAFFIPYFSDGPGMGEVLETLFSNGLTGGFTADLAIASIAFWVFVFKSGVKWPWLYVALNLAIGLSCALPAFLWARADEPSGAPDAVG